MSSADKQWGKSTFNIQVRFQNMLFPEGLKYDSINHRFGTSNVSPLYRVFRTKKSAEALLESDLVAGPGLEPGTSWL